MPVDRGGPERSTKRRILDPDDLRSRGEPHRSRWAVDRPPWLHLHPEVTGLPVVSSPDTTIAARRESETPYEPHELMKIT